MENSKKKASREEIAILEAEYKEYELPAPNESIVFFAKKDGLSISIYKNGTILYQGKGVKQASKKKEVTDIFNLYPQIGSDEVGTGDAFGPICVAAAFVKEDDLSLLNELGVDDSKKLTDEKILSIGPTIIKNFDYSQLSLNNEKFNEINGDYNLNEMKAKMHNRCLLNLSKKHPNAHLYQDEFAKSALYYKYLSDEDEVADKIFFHTKGESLFPSVALASIIARYSFLTKMKALSEHYGLIFPFGAGSNVDFFIEEFIAKYGKEELGKVAKLSWKNFDKYR